MSTKFSFEVAEEHLADALKSAARVAAGDVTITIPKAAVAEAPKPEAPKAAPKSPPKPKASGKTNADVNSAAVLAVLADVGPATAEEIRHRLGWDSSKTVGLRTITAKLLEKGVILRTGERRDTRYALVPSNGAAHHTDAQAMA